MPAVRFRTLIAGLAPRPADPGWELAAEAVTVKIRWFGLLVGFVVANWTAAAPDRWPLNAILSLGLGFTVADTLAHRAGRVFLRDLPLATSALEALFIGLLCHFGGGPDSPFRFYYLLSLLCCAVRYEPLTTVMTCLLDCLSYTVLYVASPAGLREPVPFLLTLVVFVWVAWAATALAGQLKRAGQELRVLNAALKANEGVLETRIADRTRQLEESQAQVLHQEKMAAFGLLAAGIAHEVGNPLTAISSVVQVLDRRELDGYTREKLGLVNGQLARIQAILRELVTFSRPASQERGRVSVREVVDEALGIAKFYKGGKNRQITAEVPADLPPLVGVRDQLVQVVFNLVLNAIDATGKGGRIAVRASLKSPSPESRVIQPGSDLGLGTRGLETVELEVSDDGSGIEPAVLPQLFRPYFTTKRQGTGLGLFVIRRIVEAHGGTVGVTSTVTQGTTFTVTLPTSDGQASRGRVRPGDPAESSPQPLPVHPVAPAPGSTVETN
jgi:signal transduction histidine kinase